MLEVLAQLSGTMIMLAGAGEPACARAVHEAIGKLLYPNNERAGRSANVIPLSSSIDRDGSGQPWRPRPEKLVSIHSN
jgi:hypothetical protein